MPDPSPSFIPHAPTRFSPRLIAEGGAWLFNLALFAFIASLVAAGGLFVYQRSLASTRADWQAQVAGQEAELRPDLLVQLTDLSNALGVTRELLSRHVYASNALLFVQSVTHPFVYFTALSFSRDARKIELSGSARNYQTVAEQVQFLESHPQVEKVDFGGLSRSERGLVNFRTAITFKPSLLQLRSQ